MFGVPYLRLLEILQARADHEAWVCAGHVLRGFPDLAMTRAKEHDRVARALWAVIRRQKRQAVSA